MNLISKDEKQQHKILWQYKLPDNVWTIEVKELRYRKTDDTLIIVIQEHIEVIMSHG